jgi:hypothetical protein
MLLAFWTSSVRFLRSWSGFSSAVAVLLGALKNMGFEVPLISAVPAWVWWSGAIVILFVTVVFLEVTIQKEKDKSTKAEPTIKLRDTVVRIRGKDDIFGQDNKESDKVLEALEKLREKALHGIVDIFGCPYKEWASTKPAQWDTIPRHKIPAEHWGDHRIDYMEFASDGNGQSLDLANSAKPSYIMLWLDQTQVDEIWPRPRRQINWKNPIRFNEAS